MDPQKSETDEPVTVISQALNHFVKSGHCQDLATAAKLASCWANICDRLNVETNGKKKPTS